MNQNTNYQVSLNVPTPGGDQLVQRQTAYALFIPAKLFNTNGANIYTNMNYPVRCSIGILYIQYDS